MLFFFHQLIVFHIVSSIYAVEFIKVALFWLGHQVNHKIFFEISFDVVACYRVSERVVPLMEVASAKLLLSEHFSNCQSPIDEDRRFNYLSCWCCPVNWC